MNPIVVWVNRGYLQQLNATHQLTASSYKQAIVPHNLHTKNALQ
jgi:hypothetical protein